MNSEIIKAAIDGAKVTVESDCWPLRCKAGGIRISMTKQTWNGVRTLNKTVKIDELTGGETLEEAATRTVQRMAEVIETGKFFTE